MNKKKPIRLCLGCNTPREKRELIRLVRDKEGNLSLDLTGKLPGRGAYICNNPACVTKLEKNHRLSRSFDMEIPTAFYERVRKELTENAE